MMDFYTLQNRKRLLSRNWIMISLFAPCLLLCANFASASVTYRVTFSGAWNDSDVTGTLPASAHLTPLIAATHTNGQSLWEPNGFATVGIENVAEEGNSTVLLSEISAAITAGTSATSFFTFGLSNFPSTISTTFEVFDTHTYVTAISMIAPSPDWFVGVWNLPLMSGGNWILDQTIDLTPWDAGTEEGTLFTLSNPASMPHTPITGPVGSPFIGTPVIGTLRFELISAPDSIAITAPLTSFRGLIVIFFGLFVSGFIFLSRITLPK